MGLIQELKLEKGIKEIIRFKKSVPKGHINQIEAEKLYPVCWHMFGRCNDLLAKAERYESSIKQNRDNAQLDIESESDEKSVAAKERFAKSAKRWRDLQDKRIEAATLTGYLSRLRQDLDRGLTLLRSYRERGYREESAMPAEEI